MATGSHMTRRGVVTSLAALALAGCGGVKPYTSRGTNNLRLNLTSQDSTFLRQRSVYLDVWSGPKGPGMEYLGTIKLEPGVMAVGLPTGQPLHLAMAFEEGSVLLGQTNNTTVEMPMDAFPASARWQIDVDFTRDGFTHDLRRLR
jgi:hypothetical protein